MLHPNFYFFFLLTIVSAVGCSTYSRTSQGLRYFNQARYDQALVAFQAALNTEPNNADAYYNLAATYHQLGKSSANVGNPALIIQQYDEAEKNYRLCLSKDPNHTAAYRGLAVLYMERQNPQAAFQLMIAWLNAYPAAVEPKIELARLYQEYAQLSISVGQVDIARDCLAKTVQLLEEATALDPRNFRALRAMGYLREQSGDLNNALADYRLSLQSNPNQKDLIAHIAQLEQRVATPGSWNNSTTPSNSLPGGAWGTGSSTGGSNNGNATVYNPASNGNSAGAIVYNPSTGTNGGATVYNPSGTGYSADLGGSIR